MPRFTDFHKPPNAVATYQTLGFFGSIAMSATRPVARAGPMLRSSRLFKTSAVNAPPPPCPWPPATRAVTARPVTIAVSRILFILITPRETIWSRRPASRAVARLGRLGWGDCIDGGHLAANAGGAGILARSTIGREPRASNLHRARLRV